MNRLFGTDDGMGADGFSDIFADMFGGPEANKMDMNRRLAEMPRKEREEIIKGMPKHLLKALGIKTKTIRKQAKHILSEAKLCGRDAEIDYLEGTISTFAREVEQLEKELQAEKDSKVEMKKTHLDQLNEQAENFQNHLDETRNTLSESIDELKEELDTAQAELEEASMAREMLCLSINEIDTTQSKSLIIEQIMKLKEMVAENSPGTEDLTGTEEETAASAVETESDC